MMFDTQSNKIRPSGRTARRRRGGRALQNVGLTVALISASMVCSSASGSSDSASSSSSEPEDDFFVQSLAKKGRLHPGQTKALRRLCERVADQCRDEISDGHVQRIAHNIWDYKIIVGHVNHFIKIEKWAQQNEQEDIDEMIAEHYKQAIKQMEGEYAKYLERVAENTNLAVGDVEEILDVAENDKCQEELHTLFNRYLQYDAVSTAGNHVLLQIYYRKVAAKSTSEDRFGGSDVAIVKSLLENCEIHPNRTSAKGWYAHYLDTREVEEPAKWIDGFLRQKASSEDTQSWITLPKVVVGLTLIVMLFTMIM